MPCPPPLLPAELACLRTLAGGAVEDALVCPEPMVRRLLKLGLIEPRPMTWLPVPVLRPGYCVTAAGWAALGRA